ncbi:MAG: uroporphyrinogen-III C-methyltransferase [Candidatus Heteroscillospira sp.]|jgi:uroporphyrinogen III methyltransferase/synthase
MSGKVILVGAGPGDAGLITVKGLRALQEAQVVVYDRLVGAEVLAMMPENAEKIDVGKETSHHKVPQDQINQILLDKALEGKRVVRLKGGDPFVFGRGGEELELLCRHNVPFEVVPGVTSAIAASAYGGIPVTHRDCCSSLHIITGHARAGKPLSLDFEALVRTGGTLVFLMGVTAMPTIVRGLLDAGMPPETPAAMVEKGTTPMQRRCDATLATLPAEAEKMKIGSPAIIIVGGVCALAEDFCWFDRLPLRGKKLVVTRPKDRAGTLTARLRELGAQVIEYPCIETVPISPCPELKRAIENIGSYSWLCFTSPAGVRCFADAMEEMELDARALGGVRTAAIGSGTAKELKGLGLRADLVPEVYDAAHLGAALAGSAKGRVLIPRAETGSPELTEALDRANIEFDDIAVYRTEYRCPVSGEVTAALEAGEQLYVTFTSASTVRGFVSSLGDGAKLGGVTGLCIGVQTAAEAEKYGIRTVISPKASIDALVELAGKIM